ncbi:hypothetical protein D3C80_738010 [compost metagenome]
MAERPGIGFHAGKIIAVRMAVQLGLRLHVGFQPVFRIIAGGAKGGIKRARCVALRHDEAIPLRHIRLFRVIPHHAEIERRNDVDRRKIAAGMSELSIMDHRESPAAHPQCFLANDIDEVILQHGYWPFIAGLSRTWLLPQAAPTWRRTGPSARFSAHRSHRDGFALPSMHRHRAPRAPCRRL